MTSAAVEEGAEVGAEAKAEAQAAADRQCQDGGLVQRCRTLVLKYAAL